MTDKQEGFVVDYKGIKLEFVENEDLNQAPITGQAAEQLMKEYEELLKHEEMLVAGLAIYQPPLTEEEKNIEGYAELRETRIRELTQQIEDIQERKKQYEKLLNITDKENEDE